ncbi:hypothetical protein R3P38DRAFT_3450499 [Favolaschia claudopus]|uniref:DUF6729 domain-containing protein n=1 Tax=Favolaschia claudopus TaxID=2862362 RepID=A0AAV9ZLK7_9AGAR
MASPNERKKTPKKAKGPHGGVRKGAGRPPNPNKQPKPIQPAKAPYRRRSFGEPLRWASGHRLAVGANPPAFFQPYNSHARATLGISAQSSHADVGNGSTVYSSTTAFYSQAPPTIPVPSTDPSTGIAAGHWRQLNSEFEFITENDEHADITAGDCNIDESLINEALDHIRSDAGGAEAGIGADETVVDSEIQKQLVKLKARLDREIKVHNMPLCYVQGSFYDRPPHPVFALHNGMKGDGLDPRDLYLRDVFIWLPYLLPGSPERFICTCGGALSRNGFNDDPIARRVRHIPDDFFLFTNRFICDDRRLNEPGCGKSWQGTDPHVLAQLPRQVQVAFPAYISPRGAISKLMIRLMRNSFSHRHGAAPFAEMVAEVQYLSHADNELMYTAAANSYGQTGLQQFSAFDDPKGYAGSPPSAPYLKGLFTDVVSAHRIFIERDTATKPLTIAKADHTFDVLKHMGGVKGERVFTAAYTCMNEFEEARGHSIVYSKSLEHVEDMYEYMFQGLKASQNPPTQILYTDSPQGERSFHERINTAMTLNVVPVTEWTDLPAFAVQPNIATVLVSDSIQIEDAANEILQDFFGHSSPSQLYLVALAIKSEQSPNAEQDIYIQGKIHLQTISQAFSIQDIEASLAGKNPSILDLAKYAKLKGRVDSPLASLHDLAGAILHKSFSIPAPAAPWVAPSSQLMSAELECLWEIYVTLSKLDSVGLRLHQTQAETNGQLVTLVQACKPVAEGSIVGQHEGYLNAVMDDEGNTKRINISRSRSLIKISKVLVPGAIHALHKQTMEWIMAHGSFAVVTTSQLHSRSETPPQSRRSSPLMSLKSSHQLAQVAAPILNSSLVWAT